MRPGYSLVEAIAASLIASVITALMVSAIVTQIRAGAIIAHGAESDAALALATAVITSELRDALPSDVPAAEADSLALRAFRATAIVCDTADGRATVRWAGSRTPDPAKDSAVVLRAGAEWTVPIASANALASAPCPARVDERFFRIETGTGLQPGDVLLAFERGTYHLSARALRWRIGQGGRQPLTPEIFDDARSGFDPGPGLRLYTRPAHSRDRAKRLAIPLRTLERVRTP